METMTALNQNSNPGIISRAKKFFNTYRADIIIAILIICLLALMTLVSHAQNIGVNNPIPHAKALLDLTSTDKGLLVPRVTQAQRIAIFPATDATAKGMLVYQTDNTQGFYYY